MNELQKIELEMLKAFVNVCEKLELRYYLVCGSALGAIKYQGFIPWDDDVDVALPRPDYEKFLKEATKYLPKNIFVQNYKTDRNFPSLGSKLRNIDTTYVEIGHKNNAMSHGVFIDVFPLDGYSAEYVSKEEIDRALSQYTRRKTVKLNYKRFSGRNLLGIRTNMVYLLNRMFGFYSNTYRYIEKCECVISKSPVDKSEFWRNYPDGTPGKEYEPRWFYGAGTDAMFENLRVRVPEHYDEYLTNRFGDWRADLPEDQKVGHHYYEIMDLERPYTDYIDKVYNKGRRIKLRKTPKSNSTNQD